MFCTYLDKDQAIYRRILPGVFPDFVDEPASALVRVRGRPRICSAENIEAVVPGAPNNEPCSNRFSLDERASNAVGDDLVAKSIMSPQQETQTSLRRKRGRPPKTPTKGPAAKHIKASAADRHELYDTTVPASHERLVSHMHSGTLATYDSRFKCHLPLCTIIRLSNCRRSCHQGPVDCGKSVTLSRRRSRKVVQRSAERNAHTSPRRHSSSACASLSQTTGASCVVGSQRRI